MALAMTALGRALQIRWGMIGPEARSPVAWLAIAIVLTGAGIFAPIPSLIRARGFRWLVAACLLIDYAQIVTHLPGTASQLGLPENREIFIVGSAIAALLSLLVVCGKEVSRRSAAIMLALVFAYLGNWTITNSPHPGIDVYKIEYDSAAALAQGINPYNITFADPYGPIGRYTYAPWMVQNGRLMFGYTYPPETLFDIMPFRLLQLDFRYAQLMALLCAFVMIVLIRSDLLTFAAAALFLATPQIFYVLEQGWTEPLVIVWLAATVLCYRRWPRALPITLGIFLASKQYAPAFALVVLARPRPNRATMRLFLQSCAVAVGITAPLALWNVKAFWRSTVLLQLDVPFRVDALSIAAWMGGATWPSAVRTTLPFSLLLGTLAVAIWRRRTVTISSGVALSSILFFAFSKQAFANYYLFVASAMACAIAEMGGAKTEALELDVRAAQPASAAV
jgi:hypothetical protein